jgi:steroid 5-alpha reductase family enzyme
MKFGGYCIFNLGNKLFFGKAGILLQVIAHPHYVGDQCNWFSSLLF